MRLLLLILLLLTQRPLHAQDSTRYSGAITGNRKVQVGIASFYADKFNGRLTANGDIYSHARMTAACNRLPLGTWIRVTNLRNKRTVIVQVNDRLHHKNMRLVDLSRSAAEKLGFIGRGITQVRIEVVVRKTGTSRKSVKK